MTFLVILFVEPSKFSSGISGFFHLPYTRSFYRLTRTSRVKSFSSWQTVFSITRMLLSNLSPRQPVPVSLLFRVLSLIYGAFKRKKCLRFLYFAILRIDKRLIPVCSGIFLGVKCVQGHASCEDSSIKSMFSSLETVLGCLEPCLLSVEPVSLNFFNRRLTQE